MKKLVAANWKLNPTSLAHAKRLLKALAPVVRASNAEAVFCPPVAYLEPLAAAFPKLRFGAQDIFWAERGPYTGAVAPEMVKELGADYTILGHSDRRQKFGETDAQVALKTSAALAEKLMPIVCIGEPLAVRRKGMAAARVFVTRQLKKSLKGIPKNSKVILAYEPVWSISTSGSGKKDTPEDATEMIAFIKKLRPGRVLYGGSVDAKSAGAFLAKKNIDGLLVGHASLSAKDFGGILRKI